MSRNDWSEWNSGILINVVDTVDHCTRALEYAKETKDLDLAASASSVLSALVIVLGRRFAHIPKALEADYLRVTTRNK